MHLCTKTKRNLKTHIKYNVLAMTSLKTHVKYNVFAMTNLKTHVKHNVFAMTNLKTHANTNKKRAKGHGKQKNVLKPMHLCTKTKQKGARKRNATPGYSHPAGPAIRITVCMCPCSFASPARMARTTRTKQKRRRNEADLPVTGGGQAGLTPLNLRSMDIHQWISMDIHQ